VRPAPSWPVFVVLGLVVLALGAYAFYPPVATRATNWLASTVPLLWETKPGALLIIMVVVGGLWRLVTWKRD
jgi:hypothetical protein